MATASWRGAVQISVNDVDISLHMALFPKVKSQRNESFRTLAPNGQPIKQTYLDSEGNQVDRAECSKGVEIGKGEFAALSEAQVEQVKSGEKDEVITPTYFAAVGSIPIDLATDSYFVRADAKVAGSEGNVNILWNGLLGNGLAYVTQATLKAGAPDKVLAIYADEKGLHAVAIPFEPQCYEEPATSFELDEAAAELFGNNVDEVHSFQQGEFFSTYTTRRAEVIASVVTGTTTTETPKAETTEVPDLMAALKASVAKPKAKKATKKAKVTA